MIWVSVLKIVHQDIQKATRCSEILKTNCIVLGYWIAGDINEINNETKKAEQNFI